MKRLLLLYMILIAAGTSMAQAPTGKPGRTVPTITRTIQIFSTLENEWLDAVQRRDTGALKKIVAANFELRSAAAPGTPTPREESISHSLKVMPFHSSISQMAAHEYGELVVVSFLWNLEVPPDGPLAQKVFVVDTWKRTEGDWQVVTRYTAPIGDTVKNVPGDVLNATPIDKKI